MSSCCCQKTTPFPLHVLCVHCSQQSCEAQVMPHSRKRKCLNSNSKPRVCLRNLCSSTLLYLFTTIPAPWSLLHSQGSPFNWIIQLEKYFSCRAEICLVVTNSLLRSEHTHTPRLILSFGATGTSPLLLPQDLDMVTLSLSSLAFSTKG